jgi:hypothetical protein
MCFLNGHLVDKSNELMIEVDHFHEAFHWHSFIDGVHARAAKVMTCTKRRPSVYLGALCLWSDSFVPWFQAR